MVIRRRHPVHFDVGVTQEVEQAVFGGSTLMGTGA
jgi:hypothetical protein